MELIELIRKLKRGLAEYRALHLLKALPFRAGRRSACT